MQQQLIKPYTSKQKSDFIVYWNHNRGYVITETETSLVATEPPKPTLDEVKAKKIEELKDYRNTEEKSPLLVDNLGTFDFDDDSRSRINGAMTVLEGTDVKLTWTLADNDSVEVGYDDLKSVIVAGGVRCNMLHQKYRDLRDLVDKATTVEEVNSISWDIINEVEDK